LCTNRGPVCGTPLIEGCGGVPPHAWRGRTTNRGTCCLRSLGRGEEPRGPLAAAGRRPAKNTKFSPFFPFFFFPSFLLPFPPLPFSSSPRLLTHRTSRVVEIPARTASKTPLRREKKLSRLVSTFYPGINVYPEPHIYPILYPVNKGYFMAHFIHFIPALFNSLGPRCLDSLGIAKGIKRIKDRITIIWNKCKS
jgi:hypothetical protein